MAARISYPIIRLRRLLGRPGGKTHDEAIASALAVLHENRDQAADALDQCIAQMSTRLDGHGPVVIAQMAEIIDLVEQMRDLAANYGPQALESAAGCFLDAVREHDRHPVPRENLQAFAHSLERLVQERAPDGSYVLLLEHLRRLAAHCRARPAKAPPA